MYCGVRLNRTNLQIDHIYPAEFGGPNEENNLQALCGRCNARKGIQIDADFRSRYREMLRGIPVGRPPQTGYTTLGLTRSPEVPDREMQPEPFVV